jgi:hypothetical protein
MHEILWAWRDSNPRPVQSDGQKYRGNGENSPLLSLISPKINILLQHISTRIVPEGYSSMKNGEVVPSSVQR